MVPRGARVGWMVSFGAPSGPPGAVEARAGQGATGASAQELSPSHVTVSDLKLHGEGPRKQMLERPSGGQPCGLTTGF